MKNLSLNPSLPHFQSPVMFFVRQPYNKEKINKFIKMDPFLVLSYFKKSGHAFCPATLQNEK